MRARVLQISAHEVVLNEVFARSNGEYIFDYVLNRGGAEFKFSSSQKDAREFYVTKYASSPKKWLMEVLAIVASHNYRFVHIHMGLPALLLLVPLRLMRCIVVVHCHEQSRSSSIWARILKTFSPLFFKVLASERLACSNVVGEAIYGKHFRVMRNPVNYEKFRFSKISRRLIRGQLNISSNTIVWIMVAHFHEVKNHLFALKLLKYFSDSDVLLVCVGDDLGYRDTIESFVKLNDLESQVKILSNTNEPERYLSAADLFLMPSLHEGFGIAALEAQISGLPCIISDTVPEDVICTTLVERISLSHSDEWVSSVNRQTNMDVKRDSVFVEPDYEADAVCLEFLSLYGSLICAE